MNWRKRTFSFWPAARKARPRAAVVLPLPLPVQLITSPLRRFLSTGVICPSDGEDLGEAAVGVGDEAQAGTEGPVEDLGPEHFRGEAVGEHGPPVEDDDPPGVEGRQVQVVEDGDDGERPLPA